MEQATGDILVVVADPAIRMDLVDLLQRARFAVTTVATVQAALDALHDYAFDLLLLDLHIAGMSGAEAVARVRQRQVDIGIVLTNSAGSADTFMEYLQLDGCDYLHTPANAHEIQVRMMFALRQHHQERRRHQLVQAMQELLSELDRGSPSISAHHVVGESPRTVGDLEISTWQQTVRRDGQEIKLTPTEFRVLFLLAQHAGQVLTNQHIVQEIKDCEVSAADAAELIKPHIYHLRRKLERDPNDPRYILTVRGTGYLLAADHGFPHDHAPQHQRQGAL
jgi:DNA-binding response OmpR family regulator